jgi:hypothetical protein
MNEKSGKSLNLAEKLRTSMNVVQQQPMVENTPMDKAEQQQNVVATVSKDDEELQKRVNNVISKDNSDPKLQLNPLLDLTDPLLYKKTSAYYRTYLERVFKYLRKNNGLNMNSFISNAIDEKMQRDFPELVKKAKELYGIKDEEPTL